MIKGSVAVCIPIYNGEKYIAETLESIINQTYKNIEIIVSDNGSSDNSCNIVEEYITKDNRIKLYKNIKNIGYVNNVNNFLKLTNSEYIAIYHADDIYDKIIIEKQLKVLLGNNDISAVFTQLKEYYSKTSIKEVNYSYLDEYGLSKGINYLYGGLEEYLPALLEQGNFFSCPTLMIKRNILENIGGFTDKYPSNEDLELWLKLLKNGNKLGIITENLHLYRIHENQGTELYKKYFQSQDLPMIYYVINDFLIENKVIISDKTKVEYRKKLANAYLYTAFLCYINGIKERYRKMIVLSINQYKYSLFSKYGVYQRIHGLIFLIKKVLMR